MGACRAPSRSSTSNVTTSQGARIPWSVATPQLGDACAAPDLEHGGVEVPGAQVHAAFLAALAGGYAAVIESAALA